MAFCNQQALRRDSDNSNNNDDHYHNNFHHNNGLIDNYVWIRLWDNNYHNTYSGRQATARRRRGRRCQQRRQQ